MNKTLKIILSIVVSIYLILIVFTTAFLLNRNDYGVSSFAGRYLNNTLLFIKPVSNDDVETGQKVFFYDIPAGNRIRYVEVVRKEKISDKETTFHLKDNTSVSSEYVLGTHESTTAFHFLGQLLYVLQSKWGFLFIVVFPLFLAFIYEIYAIYKEVKNK